MARRSLLFFLLAFVGVALAAGPASAAVSVSGYVKLDLQWSDKIMGGGFPSPGVAATPLDTNKDADNTQTLLDARQSRIRVTFDDTVGGVKMSGRIETDFFQGDGNALTSNSRHLRLRHAFARADHPAGFFLLAGQTWSIWMNDAIAQPNIIDFNGPAGQIFARQPQVRAGWRNNLGPMGSLVLEGGVEKHSTNNLGSALVAENQGEGQPMPLLAGKVSWLHSMFQAEAALALANNTVILTGGKDESEGAWAFQLSAQATIAPVTLVAHFQSQKGLGRLINQDFPSAFLGADNKVENIESQGFYVGGSFALSPDASINAYYGWAKADEAASVGFTGNQVEQMTSIHVN
ncbi:MAG TPA: porin, partial [Candidatus Methylomirabilis sp.]|nr:porin [Candidatus Methylomirabilis sp.]